MTSTTMKEDPRYAALIRALGVDAVEFLETGPYLDAISESLRQGLTPDEIYQAMSRELGEGRSGLVLRCYQAARYLEPDFNKPQSTPEPATGHVSGIALRQLRRERAG